MSKNDLNNAHDPELFREKGHWLIDKLADYLTEIKTKDEEMPVLPWVEPEERLAIWQTDISENGGASFEDLVEQTVRESNHLHHPHYMGHQVAVPLPMAALCDLTMSFLNNSGTIYEMAPIGVGVEQNIVRWMADQIGYGPNSGGVLTSGGSLGNLTALLAARQAMGEYNSWEEGTNGIESGKLCVLVSEQAHYSIQRAVKIMGWGQGGIEPVAVDSKFRLDPAYLEEAYNKAKSAGKHVIAVVANCCSTSTGSFDPIHPIADFCDEKKLWLHVDAAHGGSNLLSDKYKPLLKGIERANSVIWDAHKMMMMPSLLNGVIFRDAKYSHEAFSQKAYYLMEKSSREEWYNFCHRTIECTKNMMGLKLYISLSVYGTKFFGDYVEAMNDNAKLLAQMIDDADDFELAVEPESNIVCFRYVNSKFKNDMRIMDDLQARIRKKLISDGKFYIVQTRLLKGLYLRTSIMNPRTSKQDFEALLDEIRALVLT